MFCKMTSSNLCWGMCRYFQKLKMKVNYFWKGEPSTAPRVYPYFSYFVHFSLLVLLSGFHLFRLRWMQINLSTLAIVCLQDLNYTDDPLCTPFFNLFSEFKLWTFSFLDVNVDHANHFHRKAEKSNSRYSWFSFLKSTWTRRTWRCMD